MLPHPRPLTLTGASETKGMCTSLMGSEGGWLPRRPFSAGWGWGAYGVLNSPTWLGHNGMGEALNVFLANSLASESSLCEVNLQVQG